jgi:hypothetical protein
MTPEAANSIGFIGMALIVAAYAYVTASKATNPYLLHGLNLVGAALLILSLTVNRNLPSMVLESVWVAVALFGLGKALLKPSPLQGRGLGEGHVSAGSPPSPTLPPEGERES